MLSATASGAPGAPESGVDPAAIVALATTARRLAGLTGCVFLRRVGDELVECPPTDDGLRLPLGASLAGRSFDGARVIVTDTSEESLHVRERALLRAADADFLLAVPVVPDLETGEPVGLVLGLKPRPLAGGTGASERTVLALVASQLALVWRLAEAEQALTTARNRIRELEGEAEGLLHCLRSAALVLSPDNRLLEANRAAELLLGFSLAEARDRPLEAILDDGRVVDVLRAVPASGQGQLPELILDDGTVVEIRVEPVFDSRGELRQKVAVFNDTTLLKQADELKTEFVSMVSHELRTPLTSIKAFAATLLRDDVGELADQKEWLQIIDRECDRLAALINDLLTISRLESGQSLPMQFTEFDVMALLREVIAAQQELATRHTFELAGPERLALEADQDKVRQVLSNLVNNGVKYSPRGGRVRVVAGERGANIEVRVQDEGVGIRPEHLNLIFDKFFQVDGSSTRRVGGTGLGLYLTRRLVEEHQGRIWAESEPGVGSEFVVLLPKRRHVRDRLGT